jgi:hypothetical protein
MYLTAVLEALLATFPAYRPAIPVPDWVGKLDFKDVVLQAAAPDEKLTKAFLEPEVMRAYFADSLREKFRLSGKGKVRHLLSMCPGIEKQSPLYKLLENAFLRATMMVLTETINSLDQKLIDDAYEKVGADTGDVFNRHDLGAKVAGIRRVRGMVRDLYRYRAATKKHLVTKILREVAVKPEKFLQTFNPKWLIRYVPLTWDAIKADGMKKYDDAMSKYFGSEDGPDAKIASARAELRRLVDHCISEEAAAPAYDAMYSRLRKALRRATAKAVEKHPDWGRELRMLEVALRFTFRYFFG